MHPEHIDRIMQAQKEIKRTCSICLSEVDKTEHFPIYVNGSEGVELCMICKLDLTDHLSRLRGVVARSRKEAYKSLQKEGKKCFG